MRTPLEIFRDLDSQVAVGGYSLKDGTVQLIEERGRVSKAEDVAFAGVESHAPGVRPCLQLPKVLLQGVVILDGVDFPVEEAVVSK